MSGFLSAGLFNAIPDSVVDNFEATLYENQGKTLSDFYTNDQSGGISDFSRQTSTVIEGNYALYCATDRNTGIISTDTGGLPRYPSQGDTFRCRMRIATGSRRFFLLYGVQDSENYYRIRLSSDYMAMQPYINGSRTTAVDTTNFSGAEGQWNDLEISWGTDDSHNITLYDNNGNVLDSISTTENTFVDGGIGFRAEVSGSGEEFWWDNYRVI